MRAKVTATSEYNQKLRNSAACDDNKVGAVDSAGEAGGVAPRPGREQMTEQEAQQRRRKVVPK
jgi:hypothetical protein